MRWCDVAGAPSVSRSTTHATLSQAIAQLESMALEPRANDLRALIGDIPVLHAECLRAIERGEIAHAECNALRHRVTNLRESLVLRDDVLFADTRGAIRSGLLRGETLERLLAECPREERDSFVERLLGVAHRPLEHTALDDDSIDYVPSGIESIVHAVRSAPVTPNDVFVDLGSGLGKVALLAHLLTGARCLGIDIQPALVAHANARAAEFVLDRVTFVTGDASDVDFSEGTVFYLYLPFTGAKLESVMRKLEAIASVRGIVVCALGVDLSTYGWLSERESGTFWLSMYEKRGS
jgi:methylase of polypeptide subunit release factors